MLVRRLGSLFYCNLDFNSLNNQGGANRDDGCGVLACVGEDGGSDFRHLQNQSLCGLRVFSPTQFASSSSRSSSTLPPQDQSLNLFLASISYSNNNSSPNLPKYTNRRRESSSSILKSPFQLFRWLLRRAC